MSNGNKHNATPYNKIFSQSYTPKEKKTAYTSDIIVTNNDTLKRKSMELFKNDRNEQQKGVVFIPDSDDGKVYKNLRNGTQNRFHVLGTNNHNTKSTRTSTALDQKDDHVIVISNGDEVIGIKVSDTDEPIYEDHHKALIHNRAMTHQSSISTQAFSDTDLSPSPESTEAASRGSDDV